MNNFQKIKGDIFDLDVDAIVNPVNCVGVMGKGLALQFKHKFPNNFLHYKKTCDQRKLTFGKVLPFFDKETQKFIFNLPTKFHWKEESKLENIKLGLESLFQIANDLNIKSIAIPPIGCGLGKLNVELVEKEIKSMALKYPEINILFVDR